MDELESYCAKWTLSEPKLLAMTESCEVHRVEYEGDYAVLKIFNGRGRPLAPDASTALRLFNGAGIVRLFNSDENAHLLEYADGKALKSLVENGDDQGAMLAICEVVRNLHFQSFSPPSGLLSMEDNFRSLFQIAKSEPIESIYVAGARLAEKLMASEREVCVLHGDIHHENIIESSKRGWLAIDPRGLVGERTYELANVFYNPHGLWDMVSDANCIDRRCAYFADQLGLDKQRLLEFAFVYGCLSAAWQIEDGMLPDKILQVARQIERSPNFK